MVPISWTEMQCPSTGQIEMRKVAKSPHSLGHSYKHLAADLVHYQKMLYSSYWKLGRNPGQTSLSSI
ncbi:hypothetical protein KSP40_PGU020241 [Platanthera guangdongensis]|uniref:Uncharacterized protein n=1 Tax=Platanthera guangdongensis TaxID=2320717 RepID=A0ABR2LR08_9ASPA